MTKCQNRSRRKCTGRHNAFASLLCRRSDPWQSATHACFAVAFRNNSHTAPNWRLPPIEGLHCSEICKNKKCALQSNCQRYIKAVSKITQRVQRLCTGYYCGYTFKSQPVGWKALQKASIIWRVGCRTNLKERNGIELHIGSLQICIIAAFVELPLKNGIWHCIAINEMFLQANLSEHTCLHHLVV